MLMPAICLASEAMTSDSRAPVVDSAAGRLAHTNEIGVPADMPAPHSVAAVPGFAHVVVPPGATFHPWAFSSDTAAAGSYAYGAWAALAGAYGELGADGTGP